MAVHGRPTLLEIRNLFPTGFLGVIGLLGVEAANSSAHLWKQEWFLFLMGLAVILIVVGLFGFVAHYKARAVPLILMGGTIGAVLLHAPLLVSAGAAVLTLVTLFYFLSPTEQASPRETARSTLGGTLVPATLQDADRVIELLNEEIATLKRQLEDAQFAEAVARTTQPAPPAVPGRIPPTNDGLLLETSALQRNTVDRLQIDTFLLEIDMLREAFQAMKWAPKDGPGSPTDRANWDFLRRRYAEDFERRLDTLLEELAKRGFRDATFELVPRENRLKPEHVDYITERIHALALRLR